ncbi:MAG: hypothetical protein GX149_02355 [Acholeplasmataceae bacterium]|jgi:hypothetical protein|nr:hypothetical protein [Acholeplasmataceae bacterium]
MRKTVYSIMVVFILFLITGCQQNSGELEAPTEIAEVKSVSLFYNDQEIKDGILEVDITLNEINLTVEIIKTAADLDVNAIFKSSVLEVAEIDQTGKVLLLGVGETIISVSAADKKHQIVLVVEDSLNTKRKEHEVIVVGGNANRSTAAEGDYVLLTPEFSENFDFIRWEFKLDGEVISNVWTNGNIFKMLDGEVKITAIFEEKMRQLVVHNGNVEGFNLQNKEGATRTYLIPAGAKVNITALEAREGEIFIGWDYEIPDNRRGELGNPVLENLVMPNHNLNVWAIYSRISDLGFPKASETAKLPYSNASKGFKEIKNGVPHGEAEDYDLEKLNGFRFAIESDEKSVDLDNYAIENIEGSNLSNGDKGSLTVKVIFKNHHQTLPITVELYATYYSAKATSGIIEVPAGAVVTKYFSVPFGFDKPWMSLVLRKPTNLAANETILLDMVAAKALTYPNGDPQFKDSSSYQWVKVDSYKGTNWSGGHYIVHNNIGLSSLVFFSDNLTFNPSLSARINNLPYYDEEDESLKIYFRIINVSENMGNHEFMLSNSINPYDDDSTRVSVQLEMEYKEIAIFSLEINRSQLNEEFYFHILNDGLDVSLAGRYGNNLIVQMAYNDIF